MARIGSLTVCEMAFLDRQDRLCIIGIPTHLPVPRLPVMLNQLMLVGRLEDLRQIEELSVCVEIVTPNGLFVYPKDDSSLSIELAGLNVFVTLRNLPLSLEGVYRFEVGVAGQRPASVTLPVLVTGPADDSASPH